MSQDRSLSICLAKSSVQDFEDFLREDLIYNLVEPPDASGATRPGLSCGCWSSGPGARPSRPSTGSRTCPSRPARAARRPRQAALADRARLSGAEAGTRSRPLRGSWLARLSSSRLGLHRGLRLPRRRAPRHSPLGRRQPSSAATTFATRRFSPPRQPPQGPSTTPPPRSPRCASTSVPTSPGACRDVRAACGSSTSMLTPLMTQ